MPGAAADVQLRATIEDMQQRIRTRFPTMTFEIEPGEDPVATWMWARVDIDEPDEVGDLIIEPRFALQIEQRVLIDVIPVHTRERVEAMLREKGMIRDEALTAPV